ncbi:hypothetical protein QYE76_058259 [Lolium multiflorum]|uniref:Uncharacterized protein n=1 Tax=Lolium multiflorum TaxID=4521 RepID=A0AAD8T668_LOLMU|nr:hypothetical protein QYE76_058259 [Lolium multiflorum]
MYYCRPENMKTIDGCDYLYNELKRSVRNRMTPNFAQYVQQLNNTHSATLYNKKDEAWSRAAPHAADDDEEDEDDEDNEDYDEEESTSQHFY